MTTHEIRNLLLLAALEAAQSDEPWASQVVHLMDLTTKMIDGAEVIFVAEANTTIVNIMREPVVESSQGFEMGTIMTDLKMMQLVDKREAEKPNLKRSKPPRLPVFLIEGVTLGVRRPAEAAGASFAGGPCAHESSLPGAPGCVTRMKG